jgi:hypothetical protein
VKAKGKMVEVPLDYLTMTHVLLSASFDKLRQTLGEDVAMTFFSLAADSAPSIPYRVGGDVEAVKSMMKEAGYSIEERQRDGGTEYRLFCPHAAKIHPHLGTDATFCPMSQMILGVVRAKHPRSVVEYSNLKSDGSVFMVTQQD